MAYARRGGDSDVYFFRSIQGHFECCGCSLNDGDFFAANNPSVAINHLQKHRDAGHKVPEHAFDRLRDDLEEWVESDD